MRQFFVFMVIAGFMALSAGAMDFNQSVSCLRRSAAEIEENWIEQASAGFINYIENRLPEISKSWDDETASFVYSGICEIAESLKQFSETNDDKNEIREYLENLILEFTSTADSVIAGKEQATFADRLADSAKNSFYNLDKIDGNMHVYGMRTWYPETSVTKTILGKTKTYPGWLSCAYTVSAFFKGAEKSIGAIGSVTSLTGKLSSMGWKTIYKYEDAERGDVIFWKDEGSRHIGVSLGWGMAVSNSSFLGSPIVHAGGSDFSGKPFYRAYRSSW